MAQKPTPEFRAEAVRVALISGLPRKQVAADFGVGFSTLSRWIWHAPIGWSGLIVSALSASGPLERRSPVRVADIPERYAA